MSLNSIFFLLFLWFGASSSMAIMYNRTAHIALFTLPMAALFFCVFYFDVGVNIPL